MAELHLKQREMFVKEWMSVNKKNRKHKTELLVHSSKFFPDPVLPNIAVGSDLISRTDAAGILE